MFARFDLPFVLRVNALSSAACGVLMVALPGTLGDVTGLSPWLLHVVGLGLLPFALFVVHVGQNPSPGLVRVVSAMDFSWVLASVGLVVFASPTALGVAFVLASAAVVELFGT